MCTQLIKEVDEVKADVASNMLQMSEKLDAGLELVEKIVAAGDILSLSVALCRSLSLCLPVSLSLCLCLCLCLSVCLSVTQIPTREGLGL